MSNYFIPSNITTIIVSTPVRNVVMLPAASTVPGRILNVKTSGYFDALDYYVSAIRISTVGVDTLEGIVPSTGLAAYAFVSTNNTCVTLASDGGSNWMVLGNENLPFLSTQYFQPNDIRQLRVWLDAADLTTFTLSTNSTIARWQNKAVGFTSTFARPGINGLLGGTRNSQSAILGQTSLFDKPTVWFSTTSEMFVSTQLANGTNSFFAVVRPLTGLDALNPSTLIFGNIAVRDVFTTNICYNTPCNYYEYATVRSTFGVTYNTIFEYTNTENPINRPLLLSFVTSGSAASNVATYYGGVQFPAIRNNGTATTNLSNYFINNHMYSTSIEVAEIIVYSNTLSQYDRQRVEGYLAWKWGLNGDPFYNGHPFKFVSPMS